MWKHLHCISASIWVTETMNLLFVSNSGAGRPTSQAGHPPGYKKVLAEASMPFQRCLSLRLVVRHPVLWRDLAKASYPRDSGGSCHAFYGLPRSRTQALKVSIGQPWFNMGGKYAKESIKRGENHWAPSWRLANIGTRTHGQRLEPTGCNTGKRWYPWQRSSKPGLRVRKFWIFTRSDCEAEDGQFDL